MMGRETTSCRSVPTEVRWDRDWTDSRSSRGMAICRRITRRYARTFHFASHCLPREVRTHAYAVYGFCRWADNAVDDARDPSEALARIERARQALDDAYGTAPVSDGLRAFRWTVRRRGIPRQPFDALLDGMAMDLTINRYPDAAALDLYCHRVAGVVGIIMSYVFGFRHERCLVHADQLGRAMQLTNILRDVAEDLSMNRIYLPQDSLARHGVTESDLGQARVTEGFRRLMAEWIGRARELYRASDAGIPDLIGWSSRLTVKVMGNLYGGILDEIEALDYDVFHHRAHVTTSRKLIRLIRCLFDPILDQPPRPLPRRHPPRSLAGVPGRSSFPTLSLM